MENTFLIDEVFNESSAKYPLTRKERRKEKKKGFIKSENKEEHVPVILTEVKPITKTQKTLFNSFFENQNLLVSGSAGTGKTFLLLYFALQEVLKNKTHKKILIIRSPQATVDIGFLPGSLQEKIEVYEQPYINIVNQLISNKKNYYSFLKNENKIEFAPSSYLRGLTFDDTIIIVDEAQNSTLHELSTIITRVGKNTKIFISGDTSQNDIYNSRKYESGLSDLIKIVENMKSFDHISFGLNDIVRSGLVKEYLIAKEKTGL